MKKYLIILLCALGLGGCMIYPTSITHEGYFLPVKPQLYTDLNDEFNNECQDVSEFINKKSKEQDLKQYLTDRGADCNTTENICYFYFKRNFKSDRVHDTSVYIEVKQFHLLDKIYQDVLGLTAEVPFANRTSKKAIQINFIDHIMGGCGNTIPIPEQIELEAKFKQRVKEIINAGE